MNNQGSVGKHYCTARAVVYFILPHCTILYCMSIRIFYSLSSLSFLDHHMGRWVRILTIQQLMNDLSSSISLSPSFCLPHPLSISLPPSVSLTLFLSLSFYLSLSLSLSLSLPLSPSPSFYLSTSLRLFSSHLSLSVSLFMHISPSLLSLFFLSFFFIF